MGIHIDHFAGKEKVRDPLAAHGAGFDFLYTDTAAGDYRLLQGTGGLQGQGKGLQGVEQLFPLGRGDLAAGQDRRDSAQAGENFRQTGGEQARQDALELLFAGGLEVPAQPGIQLFPAQARLQVQRQGGAPGGIRQVAAGFQRQGT